MVTTIRLDDIGDSEPIEWLCDNVAPIAKSGAAWNRRPFIGEGWRVTFVTPHKKPSFTEVEIDDEELATEFVLRFK